MKHYTLEQWTRYVREELTSEEQLEYEAHLGSCDQCLERYMQCLELAADSFPVLAEHTGAAMAEAVMQSIGAAATPSLYDVVSKPEPVRRQSKPTPSFLRHPVFHYAVAAAVTFLLMGTGVFQSLAERVGSAESNVEASPLVQEDNRSSVSQLIMEKTIVMLDSIQPKHERGGTR